VKTDLLVEEGRFLIVAFAIVLLSRVARVFHGDMDNQTLARFAAPCVAISNFCDEDVAYVLRTVPYSPLFLPSSKKYRQFFQSSSRSCSYFANILTYCHDVMIFFSCHINQHFADFSLLLVTHPVSLYFSLEYICSI